MKPSSRDLTKDQQKLKKTLRLRQMLSSLLLGSAISLAVGGIMLRAFNIVPIVLIEITAVAVAALLPLSYFVFRGNMIAVNIATILGFVAPAVSLGTPAHVEVLLSFGQSLLISVLGLLQFLGFYFFPAIFLILRFAMRKRLSKTYV